MFDQKKTQREKNQCSIRELKAQQSELNQEPSQLENKKQNFLQSLLHPQQVKQEKKPIFIISPNFQQKHINNLTELLQKHNVPIQFQHETDSLGFQLNQHFFVVVDNHSRKMNLGSEFNSVLMSIVGYPKKGGNKKNIYCQTPQDVYGKYRQFIATKTRLPRSLTINKLDELNSSKTSNLIRKQGLKPSTSSLNPQIKLKGINPYTKQQKVMPLKNEQCSIQNQSLLNIENQKYSQNNLIILQSEQNPIYNTVIKKLYGQIKISENKKKQQILCFRKVQQVQSKLTSYSSIQHFKNIFIIISKQNAIQIIDMVTIKFTKIITKIKLLLLVNHQNQLNQQINQHLLPKFLKSKACHSILTSAQKCQKTLKQQGFIFKVQKSIMKTQKDQTNIKSNAIRSVRKLAWAVQSQSQGTPSQIVSNVIQNKIPEKIQEQKIKLTDQDLTGMTQKSLVSRNEQSKDLFLETKSLTKNKLIIPSISSLLQSKNSQISQGSQLSKSPSKLIKILRKQKSQVQKQLKKQDILQQKNTAQQIKNSQPQHKSSLLSNRYSQQNKNKGIDLATKRVSNTNTNPLKTQLILQNKQNVIQNLQKTHTNEKLQQTSKHKSQQFKIQTSMSQLRPPSRKLKLFNGQQNNANHYDCTKQTIPSPKIKKLKKYLSTPQQTLSLTVPSISKTHHFHIDGLIYTQYNQKIQQIVHCFNKANLFGQTKVRPFYQEVEYARTLRKIWTKGMDRNSIVVLLDLQAYQQIINYYATDAYENDQINYYQAFKQQRPNKSQSQEVIQGTNIKLLFFVVLPQKQLQNQLFNKMKSLNDRLPQYEVIKCVIEDNLDDNLMKQKSKYVYVQMQAYLLNQCSKHKHKLVQTV